MLLDSTPYKKIIASLGDAGSHLNEGHITTWKAGGFQDWLQDLRRNEALGIARDSAIDLLSKNAGATVQDASRAVDAAKLYELLLAFDPTAFAKALQQNPELYLKLVSTLARLSEGEAACGNYRMKEAAIGAKLHVSETGEKRNVPSLDALKEILKQIRLI